MPRPRPWFRRGLGESTLRARGVPGSVRKRGAARARRSSSHTVSPRGWWLTCVDTVPAIHLRRRQGQPRSQAWLMKNRGWWARSRGDPPLPAWLMKNRDWRAAPSCTFLERAAAGSPRRSILFLFFLASGPSNPRNRLSITSYPHHHQRSRNPYYHQRSRNPHHHQRRRNPHHHQRRRNPHHHQRCKSRNRYVASSSFLSRFARKGSRGRRPGSWKIVVSGRCRLGL